MTQDKLSPKYSGRFKQSFKKLVELDKQDA